MGTVSIKVIVLLKHSSNNNVFNRIPIEKSLKYATVKPKQKWTKSLKLKKVPSLKRDRCLESDNR